MLEDGMSPYEAPEGVTLEGGAVVVGMVAQQLQGAGCDQQRRKFERP
jgi:hypothetical protein